MGAPSDEDVLTLVESASGEALSEHRRRDHVADCEPADSILRLRVCCFHEVSRFQC